MSRHEIAAEVVDNLRNRAARHEIWLALMPGRPPESVVQHAAIAQAIAAGDATAAEARCAPTCNLWCTCSNAGARPKPRLSPHQAFAQNDSR
jgi:DNA-binding GntR family transcriptional regulator